MPHLPYDATDLDLITYVDRWVTELEREDYNSAFALTCHDPQMQWTADRIREVIKSYGESTPSQIVTLQGRSTDISQRKDVERWPLTENGTIGEIWYDLNINGLTSDLTATLTILAGTNGIDVQLNDIHVM